MDSNEIGLPIKLHTHPAGISFSKLIYWTYLFNKILCFSVFPNAWKTSYVVPIPKKGNKYDPDNYRGLTLSNSLCKLFCKILNARIMNYMMERGIVCKNQLGFIKGKRTSDHVFTDIPNKVVVQMLTSVGYIPVSST